MKKTECQCCEGCTCDPCNCQENVMAKDIEQAIEEVKGKGFKVSINNIIAIITFLSTVIAGWYSFTGRIDGLEEVVQGFADASDVEMVA